jgi:hypothetical protein
MVKIGSRCCEGERAFVSMTNMMGPPPSVVVDLHELYCMGPVGLPLEKLLLEHV